jgi:glutamine synthetase type I
MTQIKTIEDFFKVIEENSILFIDFRFTDICGMWHHISRAVKHTSKSEMKEGFTFDGSSIKGWRDINNSDMYFIPDVSTAFIDPFTSQPTIIVFCDVYDPSTSKGYDRDPRNIAKKAENFFRSVKIGDDAFFGPEPEFFVFDNVLIKSEGNEFQSLLSSSETLDHFSKEYPNGNSGHRPLKKGGYFPCQPTDHFQDLRSEMCLTLEECGIEAMLHHHEVASSQCEIGFKYSTLLKTADNLQKFKYIVRNVADSFGKSVTFMPKPIDSDNGSGMHVHQSIWKDGKNTFAGDKYAGLSQIALWYIGGIIKHGKALNAITNPTTNSYKRLVPGYEAPIYLAYSACNRSASIRIPYSSGDAARRIEARFPDPSSNPYLTCSALLMAGIDGILNKIDPGEATEKNLYELDRKDPLRKNSVSRSLIESIENLEKDHDFLLAGDVFTKDFIENYIELKLQEAAKMQSVSPKEIMEYYGV